MIIGILIFSEPKFEQFTGVDRLSEEAQKLGHTVIHFYEPFFNVSGKTIWYEGKPLPEIDVMIARPNFIEEPGLHAHVVRTLLQNGYRVINGLLSYGSVKNKIEQIQEFDRFDIPHPQTIISKQPVFAKEAAELVGFPLIVKVAFGTVGSGVFFANSIETFQPIVDYLQIRDRNPILIQSFIAEAERKDLRVFVVGDEMVAAMERTAPTGDVRANTSHGGTGSKVVLSEQEKTLALEVARAFQLEIAGVDLIRSKNGPLVLEVNANPGFKELENATGMNVAEAIIRYAVSTTQPASSASSQVSKQ